jgi:hypothetical protein
MPGAGLCQQVQASDLEAISRLLGYREANQPQDIKCHAGQKACSKLNVRSASIALPAAHQIRPTSNCPSRAGGMSRSSAPKNVLRGGTFVELLSGIVRLSLVREKQRWLCLGLQSVRRNR